MKKIFTLSLCAAAALGIGSRAATPDEEPNAAYYPAPAGVFYLGLDADGAKFGKYAVAPLNTALVFKCDVNLDRNDYTWDFTDPVTKKNSEVDNDNLTVNVESADVALGEAPTLYVNGYDGRDIYTMARGGILFGQGYYDDVYAGNLNTAELYSDNFNLADLSVNYPEAGANFAKNYPLSVSDVTIKGFGETFGYAGAPYRFETLRAGVIFMGNVYEAGNSLQAEIYPFSETGGVDFSRKLGTYTESKANKYDYYQGAYWVTCDFSPVGDAPLISEPVMVIFRPTEENTDRIIAPTMPGISHDYASDPVTSYIFAGYTRNGNVVENGCLPYTETFESRYDTYLKHWNVSGKIVWETKSDGIQAVEAAPAAPAAADNATYTLTGIRVVDNGQLPAGIYVKDGKKVVIR